MGSKNQLNTGTLISHLPTIITIGLGSRQRIGSGAGVERRTETISLKEWRIEQRREPRGQKKPLNTGTLQNFGCENRYMNDIGKSKLGGWLCRPHTPNKFINVGRLRWTTTQYHTGDSPWHTFYHIRLRIVKISWCSTHEVGLLGVQFW